jgi:hypothetical protein
LALSGLLEWPIVWGQATGSNPSSLALLALRRWYASLTLSSPAAVPSLYGLWAWLLGLAVLLVLAMVIQGPVRALRQVFDVPGHIRLWSASWTRLRGAGRMVAVTIGMTVVAWTLSQTLRFNDPRGRDDLLLLSKARSLGELALEHGTLTALTPVRDLYALGDNFVLLLVATALLFRALTERRERARLAMPPGRWPVGTVPETRWTNLIWGATSIYLLYRLGTRLMGKAEDLPLGGCLMIEGPVIPLLMVLCDAVMISWILVELRDVGLNDAGHDMFEPLAVVALLPGAILACLLTMPARYLATAILLTDFYLPATIGATFVGSLLRWQLGWGLAAVQGAALTTMGLAGAVAWSRGSMQSAMRGYLRLIAVEGGHLVVLLLLAGVAAGSGAALAYLLVLSLPASTWVLAAADSYAHYVTLPIGLLTLAALVELGERALPSATLAAADLGVAAAARLSPGAAGAPETAATARSEAVP